MSGAAAPAHALEPPRSRRLAALGALRLGRAHLFCTAVTAALLIFVLTPLAVLIIFSFNASPYYQFPLEGFTFVWYRRFFSNAMFIQSFENSVYLALQAAAIATVLASAFAYGMARSRFRFQRVLAFVGMIPLFVPTLVLAIALEMVVVRTHVIGLGHLSTLIGHVVFVTPFATLIVWSWMAQLDWRLEKAARDLGASYWQALRYTTVPMAWIGIRSGLILGFLLSFNEYNLSLFLSAGFNTLPVQVASASNFGLRPDLLAYSTVAVGSVLLLVLVLLPLFGRIFGRNGERP